MITRRGWVALVLVMTPIGCGGAAFDATSKDDAGGASDGATPPPDAGTLGPDSASDGGASGDGGGDAAASPCPASVPSAGAACTRSGLECEYGTSPVTACNTVATCAGSTWTITPPNSSGGACRGSLDSQCPATYALVPKGSHCSDPNLVCDYPRGRCACEAPTGGIVVLADASLMTTTWMCQTGTTGCPDTRPALGTACSPEGTSCDYGACTIPDGTAEECTGGVWQSGAIACPASQ